MIRAALTLVFVGGVAVLSAQSPAVVQTEPPLAFELVSIKPNNSGANSSSVDTHHRPPHFHQRTLRVVIQRAYQIQAFQLVGAPDWAGTARFDITAQAPDGVI